MTGPSFVGAFLMNPSPFGICMCRAHNTAEFSSIREPGRCDPKTNKKHEHAHAHACIHTPSQRRRDAIASASAAQAKGEEEEEDASAAGEGQVLFTRKNARTEQLKLQVVFCYLCFYIYLSYLLVYFVTFKTPFYCRSTAVQHRKVQ